MHAYIIVGSPQDCLTQRTKLCEAWHVSPYDVVTLDTEEPSIGIALVRQFQSQLILSPYNSALLVGVIGNAERLTIEAQNALLKLLEEPPPKVKLLLETASPLALLPTILSRCHEIILSRSSGENKNEQETNANAVFDELRSLSPGKRLAYVDKLLTTKDGVGLWITDTIVSLEALIMHQPTLTITQRIRHCLTAQRRLVANVNPRLTLDMLLLNIT